MTATTCGRTANATKWCKTARCPCCGIDRRGRPGDLCRDCAAADWRYL